jgi:hypothetical protein
MIGIFVLSAFIGVVAFECEVAALGFGRGGGGRAVSRVPWSMGLVGGSWGARVRIEPPSSRVLYSANAPRHRLQRGLVNPPLLLG